MNEETVDELLLATPDTFALEAAILRMGQLSRREYQVAIRLVTGRTNLAISRELGISEGTVKVHVGRILQKLGLESRTGAAVVAALYVYSRQNAIGRYTNGCAMRRGCPPVARPAPSLSDRG
ncbi:LuxR C-terminal-related transcriptional regulator [Streptomyces sp. NPDC005474]|uniref:response regulator transcription factor n=1 Tax=Streptomyces sp. NPDC005474 TaxID=3154878 RepID=UPI0034522F96